MTVEEIRERIAAAEARGAKESSPALTVTARSVRGLGVRPRVVEWLPDGRKTYVFTLAQCRRLVELHG